MFASLMFKGLMLTGLTRDFIFATGGTTPMPAVAGRLPRAAQNIDEGAWYWVETRRTITLPQPRPCIL